MEKGNAAEQSEVAPLPAGSQTRPPGAEGAPEGQPGTGDGSPSAPDASAPTEGTTVRDPWAGIPDRGTVTLPDGTTLRRHANGWARGPKGGGPDQERVWDDEQQRWLDHGTQTEAPEAHDWGDPESDWQEAWGGPPVPDDWKGVPRSGTTVSPDGTRDVTRTPDGRYETDNASWDEQRQTWTDIDGRPRPDLPDPVAEWKEGARLDAEERAHPERKTRARRASEAQGGPWTGNAP